MIKWSTIDTNYINYLKKFDNRKKNMNEYILKYLSVKIYRLSLLQSYYNSKEINIPSNKEILENFIDMNDMKNFFKFVISSNLSDNDNLKLFFECFKENYRIINKQPECSKIMEVTTHRKSRMKGVYFPNYKTKKLNLIMPDNFSLEEKPDLILKLIEYLPNLLID